MGKILDRWKRLIMDKLRKASGEKKRQKKLNDPAVKPENEAEEALKAEKEKKTEKDKKNTEADQKKKKEKEKEEEKADKKADKEKADKEKADKKADEKANEEVDENETEKEDNKKDLKEQKPETQKAKKAKKDKKGKNEKNGKNAKVSSEDSKTEAAEADQELAGDLLKHMLEYEQTNEKPENRVLHELVNSGNTDDLVKILSADDQFRAEHMNTEVQISTKDSKTVKTVQTDSGKSQTSQAVQNLADAFELARENEKETKILEEQREKMGYQDLLAMETPSQGSKIATKRVIRRPVKELKLQAETAENKPENKPMEPPPMMPMGPKLPSRRKKPEQDE